jgi:hypothetical protein
MPAGHRRASIAIAVVIGVIATLGSFNAGAHKPITSPYTFNEDVFPIVRDRCGRCHVEGGVAPMSLMTHEKGVPWGESIRAELIAGHMPPWSTETAPDRFRNAQRMSARDLNVLLTWVTGGTPIGNADRMPPPVTVERSWKLGIPDLVLAIPSERTIAADVQDLTEEFTIPTGLTEARWLTAVDVLPGNHTVVRNVSVRLKPAAGSTPQSGTAGAASQAGALTSEPLLALWVPGDDPLKSDTGGFRLPAGAELLVSVHYRKTWEYERAELKDRTSVGLYFGDGGAEVRAIPLVPSASEIKAGTTRLSFSRPLAEDVRAVAIYPDPALARARVRVDAVLPDGQREELIAFTPRAGWARRYWFARPVSIAKGTRLEVTASLNEPPLLPPGAAPPPAEPIDPASVRLTVNVVK